VIGRSAGLSHFPTVLIEVGLAAAAVAVWSGAHRGQVTGRPRRELHP